MKIAILRTEEGFNEADRAKLDTIKADLQKAMDDDANVVVVLPANTSLDFREFEPDDYYEGDDHGDDEDGEEGGE